MDGWVDGDGWMRWIDRGVEWMNGWIGLTHLHMISNSILRSFSVSPLKGISHPFQ